jgi:hypothetical protein
LSKVSRLSDLKAIFFMDGQARFGRLEKRVPRFLVDIQITDRRNVDVQIAFLGQRPLVPLLLLGPPFTPIILFGSTTLLTGMTGISLHMKWPLTSQSHGSDSQREQLVFCY